jgi:hypothetical protein
VVVEYDWLWDVWLDYAHATQSMRVVEYGRRNVLAELGFLLSAIDVGQVTPR